MAETGKSTDAANSDTNGFPAEVAVQAAASGHIGRWLLWLTFVAATVAGLLFQLQILRGIQHLIPPPDTGRQVLYWTSPMDASVRSDKPGKTAMGMELIPVYADQPPQEAVVIDATLIEREVTTALVQYGSRVRTIETVGTIAYAEPRIADVTLKVDAWIEKLHVNYKGQPVRRGDPLVDVYSPNLVSTQEEVLIGAAVLKEARGQELQGALARDRENLEASKQRLRYVDVTDKQIDELIATGKVPKTLTFFSPADGIVTEKEEVEGSFVKAGDLLYRIADLSVVWADVYVYPNQIHCVYEGQQATLTLPNLPGQSFQGKVVYIYPYLDPKNRTVQVRLEFLNPELLLKPGMFAEVHLEPHRMGEGINVLRQAVMHTGRRDLAYVVLPGNKFEARELTLGMELDGGMVEVLAGLPDGERIVTSEEFLMDSDSRLRSINLRFEPAPAWEEIMTQSDAHEHGMMPGMKMNDQDGRGT
jgi:Cu(I)/Ag(I) efflux system membrane fusion protein/cobalt-zinc-cadmium efflux system membrane fusion protein